MPRRHRLRALHRSERIVRRQTEPLQSVPGQPRMPSWVSSRTSVPRRPFRQQLILLLLRQLQVLLAEEPEPRTLRAILTAGITAAHVPLEAAGFPDNAVAASPRQSGRDSLGEHLRETINQGIEWVRRAFGHMVPLLEERSVVQAMNAPRWPNRTPRRSFPGSQLPLPAARGIARFPPATSPPLVARATPSLPSGEDRWPRTGSSRASARRASRRRG